jgi:hypothetical protein
MVRSSLPMRSATGSMLSAPRRPTSNQAHLGRMGTAKASTPDCETNCSTARSFPQPARNANPDRAMEEALQYETPAQCLGLPPAGTGNHRPDGPKTDHVWRHRLPDSFRGLSNGGFQVHRSQYGAKMNKKSGTSKEAAGTGLSVRDGRRSHPTGKCHRVRPSCLFLCQRPLPGLAGG